MKRRSAALAVFLAASLLARPEADAGVPEARVKLTRIATLSQPIAMAVRAGDQALYFAEKGGRIRVIRNGALQSSPLLDISSGVSKGGEQGLLGLAISPDGAFLYVNFTNLDGDTRVREYAFTGGPVDKATQRDVIRIDQPFANHNGGHLAFGPDGFLYIGMGDGGGAGDPQNNAQNIESLLGKMLRINPRQSGTRSYTIPATNPLVGRPGRDEIWSLGLRNPWRYSFDKATGDMWIGDVGQNTWEEVDFSPRSSTGGENYGWDGFEGTHVFSATLVSNHHPPLHEYAHGSANCSVTGGYVYRGSRIPDLRGAYVFGDFCAGRVLALTQSGGQLQYLRSLGLAVSQISSFGQSNSGELYVLSLSGPVYRIDPV